MNEFFGLLINLLEQIERHRDSLSPEEMSEIAAFIRETIPYIEEQLSLEEEQEPPAPPAAPVEAPMPMGADLLWILSGGQPDAFVNYLRTYPDPVLNALANNREQLTSVVNQLSQTMPAGERPSQDGIQQAPLDSSNIYGFQYDPKSGGLKVRFQSGSVYAYQGISPAIFKIFQAGAVPARTDGRNQYGRWWRGKMPSLGAAFYQLIRQGPYPYRRLR